MSKSDASILIQGESGVGKDFMARFIHKQSKRRDHPYTAINCAALPRELITSELFGYEGGAYRC
ncbi:sigma 54-interacting transcriptional regulator [Bacillus sp. V5-8f]|uniref:sigma 54-interacting transcriptional regulator n=1 Tax=Bacillus sp. V5-8f TaxID=2053044 RepID=UPI0035B51514